MNRQKIAYLVYVHFKAIITYPISSYNIFILNFLNIRGFFMKVNYLDIGKRIRTARLSKGIKQDKLAEMVDVGTTHISHIETGNTIPSMKLFLAIANVLEVSTDSLLCDNMIHARTIFHNQIAQDIQDCSEKEIRIISQMIQTLKSALRQHDNDM